jgi:hypothetical protein
MKVKPGDMIKDYTLLQQMPNPDGMKLENELVKPTNPIRVEE